MSSCLVMEGGAMRGLFTAGVLDSFMAAGLTFDAAIGVSAGATFGCNLKSRQRGRVLRYNRRFCRDWRYCSVRSLLLTGDLYGARFCYETLPFSLDPFDTASYRANPMAFFIVATDADTGEAVYRRVDFDQPADMDWIRASASMPVVSRPVEIGGRRFLDGGVADPIPFRWALDQGFDRVVAILTQPADYVKPPLSHPRLFSALLRRTPAIAARLRDRSERYNRQKADILALAEAGRVQVIQPESPLNIGAVCHRPEELDRVYQLGLKAGETFLQQTSSQEQEARK